MVGKYKGSCRVNSKPNGSGLSNTVNAIKGLEPDADVTDGLHIGSSGASNPDSAVKK